MLLAQVLLEAGELVHDEDLEDHSGVQDGHGDLSDNGEQEGHEAQQDHEDEAASEGVHESKVHRNHSRHSLWERGKQIKLLSIH